ncbi:hypothetical protein D3C72_1256130 [compost metagenome]
MIADAEHGIAARVVGDSHIRKIVDACEADQIDLVRRRVETVYDVVADRLGEHEGVGTGRTGQVVVGGQGEDRCTWGIDFDVVEHIGARAAAVAVVPVHIDIKHQRTGEFAWSCHSQCAGIAGLHGPGAIAIVGSCIEYPPRRSTTDGHRHGAADIGPWNVEGQIDGFAGNACRKVCTAPGRTRIARQVGVAVRDNVDFYATAQCSGQHCRVGITVYLREVTPGSAGRSARCRHCYIRQVETAHRLTELECDRRR